MENIGLISIVIPTYNVAEYLSQCIDSVLNQSYKNIELIIVDDCSTDNTIDIINSYIEKYNNIYLYRNTENHGAGYTRNYGLHQIHGEYFMSIDGDDYITEDFIFSLYSVAEKTNSDITSGGMMEFTNGELTKLHNLSLGTFEGKNKFTALLHENGTFTNNKLIKTHLLENVEFSTQRLSEDFITIYKLLYYSNKITYIDNYGYIYRMNNTSVTHQLNNIQKKLYVVLGGYQLYDFFKDKDTTLYSIFQLRNNVGSMFIELKNLDKETYYNSIDNLKQVKQELIKHKDLIPKKQEKYYNAFMKLV